MQKLSKGKPTKSLLPDGGRYLDTTEVMHKFGISRFTLRRWTADHHFPAPIKINHRNYFREGDIFKWELRQEGIDPDAISEVNGLRAVSDVLVEYDQFVKAMVKQRSKLGLSCQELDARSGMQEGYSNKLENYHRPNGRGMGADSFPLWLGGLRLGIVLVELPKTTRNFQKRLKTPIDDLAPEAS